MSISSTVRRAGPFACNGSTTAFPFTFKVFQASDVVVTLTDSSDATTTLVLNSTYTVSLNSNQDVSPGGTVTTTSAYATGNSITLTSAVPSTQPMVLTNTGGFYPGVINDEADRLTILIQQEEEVNSRQLTYPVGDTAAGDLPNKTSRAGYYLAFDADGEPVASAGVGSDSNLRSDLAKTDGTGSTLVSYKLGETGSSSVSLFNIIDKGPILANSMFGTAIDPTGATECSAGLINFYNACINEPKRGGVLGGNYKITLGQLAFDNGHVDTDFPWIETGGYRNTIFTAAANADAAFLSFTNGTASSGAGKFWMGGRHGGVSFKKASGSAAAYTNMHGLSLRGFFQTHFGEMYSDAIGGDTGHIPRLLYGGSNPDPYHVAFCWFEGFQSAGARYLFFNDNYVGFNGNWIDRLYCVGNTTGAYKGYGAANTVRVAALDTTGWAFSDNYDGTGGSSRSFRLLDGELDAVQYGIELARIQDCEFTTRINHTFEAGPALCWPITSLSLAPSSSVTDCKFDIIHRINAGCTKPTIGKFVDFNSAGANISDVRIFQRVDDNAGLSLTNGDLFANFNANSRVSYTDSSGLPIIDTLGNHSTIARAAAGQNIGTSFGDVPYATEIYDPANCYDTSAYTHTILKEGTYDIEASICLTFAAQPRVVNIQVMLNGSAIRGRTYDCTSTAARDYVIRYRNYFAKGDVIKIQAKQDSGGAVALTTIAGAADNLFTVTPVK